MKKYLIALLSLLTILTASEPQSFWETYTAALRGDKVAQFQTGVIYERGIGVEENQTMAAQWYEKAAKQGYIDAQYNIAIMYTTGRGVSEDKGLAMMWLSLAAKQGDKEARKLLLEIIDGKHDERPKKTAIAFTEGLTPISPVRLSTKEGATVCIEGGECSVYPINTTLTSRSKRGKYYKISGIGTATGWQPFAKEGWIDEASVRVVSSK